MRSRATPAFRSAPAAGPSAAFNSPRKGFEAINTSPGKRPCEGGAFQHLRQFLREVRPLARMGGGIPHGGDMVLFWRPLARMGGGVTMREQVACSGRPLARMGGGVRREGGRRHTLVRPTRTVPAQLSFSRAAGGCTGSAISRIAMLSSSRSKTRACAALATTSQSNRTGS